MEPPVIQGAHRVGAAALVGVEAIPVVVEATSLSETGTPRVLGSPDSVVREALIRTLNAFSACGLPGPRGAPLLNLTPADVPKRGSGFDLPIALALAGAADLVPRAALRGVAALGEVTLHGDILPAPGAVAFALAARARGWTRLWLHPDDAARASLVAGVQCLPVRRLDAAVLGCAAPELAPDPLPPRSFHDLPADESLTGGDLADIRGHETPKTALMVAAAGQHDLLMSGPPGSGKSALALRLAGILPPADDEQRLDVLRIHSLRNDLHTTCRLPRHGRPFRAPHHSSSAASILGGGTDARPGEVTFAHHGLLFLDELPEFRREVLEGLRQPLEDRAVTIGRVARTVRLPADFTLVAAMNPCPCGYAGHPRRPCRCSDPMIARYRARVSGPLLDRFDLRVEVPVLDPEILGGPAEPEWSTASLGRRVEEARARQRRRNPGGCPNGRLPVGRLEQLVRADSNALARLTALQGGLGLSGRARVRLLRTARTVADLEDRDEVGPEHILEAARLRGVLESVALRARSGGLQSSD